MSLAVFGAKIQMIKNDEQTLSNKGLSGFDLSFLQI